MPYQEVEEVLLIYKTHRDSPPPLPNYPKYASMACWCKGLECRLEEAVSPVMTLFPDPEDVNDDDYAELEYVL